MGVGVKGDNEVDAEEGNLGLWDKDDLVAAPGLSFSEEDFL